MTLVAVRIPRPGSFWTALRLFCVIRVVVFGGRHVNRVTYSCPEVGSSFISVGMRLAVLVDARQLGNPPIELVARQRVPIGVFAPFPIVPVKHIRGDPAGNGWSPAGNKLYSSRNCITGSQSYWCSDLAAAQTAQSLKRPFQRSRRNPSIAQFKIPGNSASSFLPRVSSSWP